MNKEGIFTKKETGKMFHYGKKSMERGAQKNLLRSGNDTCMGK